MGELQCTAAVLRMEIFIYEFDTNNTDETDKNSKMAQGEHGPLE